jgi:hypothetical protein
MTKKKIKPHKGGRTERLYIRCTPDTKKTLKKIAEKEGITPPDLIEKWVKKYK